MWPLPTIIVKAETVVTGGGNDDRFLIGAAESLLEGLGFGVGSDTHADNRSAVGGSIVYGLDDCRDIADAIALQNGQRHNAGKRISADNADSVEPASGGYSGAVSTVAVIVSYFARIVDEVPAIEVVDETVAVIIVTICAVEFSLIIPDVYLKVGVVNVNAGIENSDNRAFLGNYRLSPKFGKIDVLKPYWRE